MKGIGRFVTVEVVDVDVSQIVSFFGNFLLDVWQEESRPSRELSSYARSLGDKEQSMGKLLQCFGYRLYGELSQAGL